MLESFDDLVIDKGLDSIEKIIESITSQIGINLDDCKNALSASLKEKSEEIVSEMINLIPGGDYSKLTEDPVVMLSFLKEEAVKIENWELSYVDKIKDNKFLIQFVFKNKSVDDGDNLIGHTYVGPNGIIRHSFVKLDV